MISKTMAMWYMKAWQAFPSDSDNRLWELAEIFRHPQFLSATENEKRTMMFRSAQAKYESEVAYPWDHYFGLDLRPFLKDAVALDLGCFTGGRGTAWAERYQLKHLVGMDVAEVFIEAARQFAPTMRISADFRVAKGESIPLDSESVDAVLSFDVFEHVQNPENVLRECHRVLKPGGKAFIVFPSYYQPMEHHLSLVTRAPGAQYFFSGQTLVQAYCELLKQRGHRASWYERPSCALEAWEKGHTINGLTLRRFKKLLGKREWRVIHQARIPIGAIGRVSSEKSIRKILGRLLYPLTFVPGLQEIFLHRVTFILQKV